MKRRIKVTLDFTKLFNGLIISKAPGELEFEIEETPENYKTLCSSEFIKTWKFVEDEENKTFSENNYSEIEKEFIKNEINIKDLRDIIMISYSYYCVSKMRNGGPKIDETIKYYLTNKDSIRNKIYSEELILSTLSALSETSNPLLDFLRRLEDTKGENYITFEEFYKKLYEPKK